MKCTLIQNETGEILSNNFILTTISDIERKKIGAEKSKLSNSFKKIQHNILGNFVFFIFKDMDNLSQVLNDNYLVKFIYLGTYVKTNGALMLDNNTTYITKKKMKELLNISDKTFKKFYKTMIDNELLTEKEDNNIYINLKYFYKGKKTMYHKITKKHLKYFTRIYIETTRELYNNTPTRQHSKLAIAYKLLPFVNWKFNILCTNINETDKNKLQLFTIKDIIHILNYNKNNLTRFKKDFYNIKCKNNKMFMTIQKTDNYKESMILVNPLVFYRGNDIDELKYLVTLFNIKIK